MLAVVIGLAIGFAAVPGIRRLGPAALLRRAVDTEVVLLSKVGDALRSRVPHQRELIPTFRAATIARLNLTANGSKPEPTEAEKEAAERSANGLDGLSATMAALLDDRDTGPALAPAMNEIARWLDPDTPEPGPLTSLDNIDSDHQVLLDAMTAHARAVRAVLTEWTSPAPTTTGPGYT